MSDPVNPTTTPDNFDNGNRGHVPPPEARKTPAWVWVLLGTAALFAAALWFLTVAASKPCNTAACQTVTAGTPLVPSATPAASTPAATQPVLSNVKNVLVTFGHRCRIFNQEGDLLAQRYLADEKACANFEANFRAKISDPGSVKSIQAFADKPKS